MPPGFLLVGFHTNLLMFCSECGEREKLCRCCWCWITDRCSYNQFAIRWSRPSWRGDVQQGKETMIDSMVVVDFLLMVTFTCSDVS